MRTWPILAVLSLCAVANAQGKDNKAESDKLFNEGITLFNDKNYPAAHQRFVDAYAKFPSPSSLFNMARTELLLENCPSSIVHYRAYLALPDNPHITETNRANARVDMAACVAKVGRLNVKAPSGTSVLVDGAAAVWVEGEPIDVAPGAHSVELRNTVGARSRKVDAPAGKVTFVEWDEPVVATAPPANPQPNPAATQTTTPQTSNPVASATPAPQDATRWVVGGSLLGVGAIGVGVGVVMALASNSTNDEARSMGTPGLCFNLQSPGCVAYSDKLSSASTQSTLSYVGYIAGGAFLAGGIAAILLWPPSKTPTARLTPSFAPGHAGAAFSTSF